MHLNEREIGYVEYEISIYDGDNDLVEIYKAYSEKEKDELIKKHFPSEPWNQMCYVSKKETTEIISKTAWEVED